jgi:hypothetical protein
MLVHERKTTPSSGSPVVTKRQSAMISLRASATIIVLRMPIRLSVVRARYHNASALTFDSEAMGSRRFGEPVREYLQAVGCRAALAAVTANA